MSITLIDSDRAKTTLGVSFRRHRCGPEQDLIKWFLDEFPIRVPEGNHATVFREPKIESGFPDLVLVIWNVSVAAGWSRARAELTINDLKLLHYLHYSGSSGLDNVHVAFRRDMRKGLTRLVDAGVVQHSSGKWRAKALSSVFAARQIIAVEAKVSEWSTAMDQALLNTWFASQSYILLPKVPQSGKVMEVAHSLGLGICSAAEGIVKAPPRIRRDLPRSYVSWLFNDLAWRVSTK